MRIWPVAATLCAISLAPLQAQTIGEHFVSLQPLIGQCWVGTFPDGKQTDEHCFTSAYDGKFVRDRHVVRGGGPYEGETLYHWDAKAGRIAFTYWGSGGDVITGAVLQESEGLVFPQSVNSSGEVTLKSVWSNVGPTGYRVQVSQKSGDTWKTLWTMDMKEKR